MYTDLLFGFLLHETLFHIMHNNNNNNNNNNNTYTSINHTEEKIYVI